MSDLFLVTASWKARHDEPLDENDRVLRMYPLPTTFSPSDYAPTIEVDAIDGLSREIQQGRLPMAVVSRRGGVDQPTHLLLRFEREAFQLVRPPLAIAADGTRPLLDRLVQAFVSNHLYLNNFECFYSDHASDEEACEFQILTRPDPERWARHWLDHVACGECAGFALAFCDEVRLHDYRTSRAVVLGATPTAFAAEAFDESRKRSWDAGGARLWQRGAQGDWRIVENRHIGSLESTAPSGEFRPAPALWTVAAEVRCEARTAGHVFAVRFEHVVADLRYAPTRHRCVIRYARTRGNESLGAIARDLADLATQWRRWAGSQGLQFTECGPGEQHHLDLALMPESVQSTLT